MQNATEKKTAVVVWINDRQMSFDQAISIDQLLKQLMIANPAIAVEVNRELVPRANFSDTFLSEDDRVEIVTLSGGG